MWPNYEIYAMHDLTPTPITTVYPPDPLPFYEWCKKYNVGRTANKVDPTYQDWTIMQGEHIKPTTEK